MNDDFVTAPSHYTWCPVIEPRQFLIYFDYHRGAALEYIWRAGRKQGEPARRAIEKAIESLKNYLRYYDATQGASAEEMLLREEDLP